jgi:dihydrofolate reductase
MFKELTIKAGVLIMGSKTYDTIGKPLPGRKKRGYEPQQTPNFPAKESGFHG